MASACLLDDDNIVRQIIIIPDNLGLEFDNLIKNDLKLSGRWVNGENFEKKSKRSILLNSQYKEDLDIFIDPQPYPSWILNENYIWEAPVKNNLRNTNFGYLRESTKVGPFLWDEEKQRWQHSGVKFLLSEDNKRVNGFYFISKSLNVSNKKNINTSFEDINVTCNPKAYRYHEVHPDYVDGYRYKIFEKGGYGEPYGASIDNPLHNYVYDNYCMIYDGAPYFFITFSNLVDLNIKIPEFDKFRSPLKPYQPNISLEFENLHIQQHPFISAKTIVELFRLIIDWDLAYHHFNNRENIGILCHDIMSTIKMPNDVYHKILQETQPSPVARYLMGEKKLFDFSKWQKSSDDLIKWFEDKYWDLQYLKYHTEVNINQYFDKHYYL